jgi:hypothetical protein
LRRNGGPVIQHTVNRRPNAILFRHRLNHQTGARFCGTTRAA